MSTELKNVSETNKTIRVEIAPDIVRGAYDRVSKKYASKAQVPGFRKGMAPLDVIRMRYKGEIRGDVFQELVPTIVTEAVIEHQLSPITEPRVVIDQAETVKVNGAEPIVVEVHIEVMPDIPEPKFEGLEVTRQVAPVKDEEIDGIIDEERQKEASFVPSEGKKSKEGDTVIVDLKGTFEDDPEADPIEVSDLDIKLGDEVIEKSFTENMVGMKPDEEKEFSVAYPEDFSSTTLAGRKVKYHALVKSVGSVELPELDDAWVKSLDEEVETVKDLRKKLRTDLETVAKADADARVRNELIAKLIEANEFEVPEALIENQARNLLNNFAQDLAQRGVDLSKLDQAFAESSYSQMRMQAERDVRGAILLEKIAEQANVEITDEMVAEEIEKIAQHYNMPADEVKKVMEREGNLDSIRNNLRTREAVEVVVNKAKIVEKPWIDNDLDSEETANGESKPVKKTKAKPAKKTDTKKADKEKGNAKTSKKTKS
ncbi:MAG: trigger factor [Pyrinomonadaceae bacterium]